MREFLHLKSVMERRIRPERRGKSESVQQRDVSAMNKRAAFVALVIGHKCSAIVCVEWWRV